MDWGNILSLSLAQALGPTAIIYCLAAIGLNVHFGYTGLLNFGQAGFMMVAGYALVSLNTIWGLSLWLGFLLGIVLTILLALLLGVPTLRLRADYLAIVTIAAAEIIRQTISAAKFSETFGGQDGVTGFIDGFRDLNPYSGTISIPGIVSWRAYDFWVMTVGWIIVALSCLVVYLLMRSPWGRVLRGIREDEDAVRSLGKNVYAYKLQSLAIGGIIGALGGVMFAIGRQSVVPDSLGTLLTFFAYLALVLGGAARVFGPVIGSMVFFFVSQFVDVALRQAIDADHINFLVANEVGIVRNILVGVGLMALMVFRPQGIIGDKREVAVSVRR